jgi:hypothetical protein
VAGLLNMAQIGLGLASGLLSPPQLGECGGSIYRAACRVWLVLVFWQRLCVAGVRFGAGLVDVRLNMAQIGLGLASGLLSPRQLGECVGNRSACLVWLVMVVWQRLCGIGVRVAAELVDVRLNMAQIGVGLASGLLSPPQLGECGGSRTACLVWLSVVVRRL